MPYKKFSFSLSQDVYDWFAEEAQADSLTGTALMRIVLDRYAASNGGPANQDAEENRRLAQAVATVAECIWAQEGQPEDVTARAVKVCQEDATWLRDVEALIGEDPFTAKRNPQQQSLNQNIGYWVKKRLNARNKGATRETLPQSGLVISSCTALVPG